MFWINALVYYRSKIRDLALRALKNDISEDELSRAIDSIISEMDRIASFQK